MPKSILNRKSMVLYMVLVSIMVAMVLASSILNIILSQARFSHHEASRIQAYYAALAGANYAFERLRSGNQASCWPSTGTDPAQTHYICKNGGTGVCAAPTACDVVDDSLPHSVAQIAITVGGTGPSGTLLISSKATFTYTAP